MVILEQIGAVVITMSPVQKVVVIVTMIAIVLVFSNVETTIVKPTILAPVATGARMQIAATVLISFCFLTKISYIQNFHQRFFILLNKD